MADRETVMKGLETCIRFGIGAQYDCTGCPYDTKELLTKCITKMQQDVIELMQQDALELMKKQKPVIPVLVADGYEIVYRCGACGTVMTAIKDTVSAKWIKDDIAFCKRCGRAVKW